MKTYNVKGHELKPCPFCGGEPRIHESRMYLGVFSIVCSECPAKIDDGEDHLGLKIEEAINAWNKRFTGRAISKRNQEV